VSAIVPDPEVPVLPLVLPLVVLDVLSVVVVLSVLPELHATAKSNALPKMIFFIVLFFTFKNDCPY
jgi:hypothetical protein